MAEFDDYLKKIDNPEHLAKFKEIFTWMAQEFPQLQERYAWNQPMYTDHGTFIIAFTAAKKHVSVAPEGIVMEQFSAEIERAGLDATKKMFRMPWDQPFNYELLRKIIENNILEKAETTSFWR